MAGGGRVKSFKTFPGREQNVFHSHGGGPEKVPGEGTSKRFQVPGGGGGGRIQGWSEGGFPKVANVK